MTGILLQAPDQEKDLMRPSTDSWKCPHGRNLSPPSSTTVVSSGKTAQLGTGSRVLQSTGAQVFIQVVEEPAWRDVVLHFVLKNEERRTGLGCEGWGSLGCSDHDMVELLNVSGGNRAQSRVLALDFRRANFGLFRDLLGNPMG